MPKNFQQYALSYIILHIRDIFLKIHKYFHIDVHPHKINTLSKPLPLRLFLIQPLSTRVMNFISVNDKKELSTHAHKSTTPVSLLVRINQINNIYFIVNMKTLNLGEDMCVEFYDSFGQARNRLMFIMLILQTLHAVGVITECSQYYTQWKRVFTIKLQFV